MCGTKITAELFFQDCVPAGFAANCPFCQQQNQAPFTPDGRLVWWPNSHFGSWCTHCIACYAGQSPGAPEFLFRSLRPSRAHEAA